MKHFLVFIFICFSVLLNAQNIIVKNGGTDTIPCNIIREDNKYLFYVLPNDTIIQKISHNDYDYYKKTVIPPNIILESQPIDTISSPTAKRDSVFSFYKNQPKKLLPFFYFGLGLGLDYGGLGSQLTVTFLQQYKFFIALGYNLSEDPGFNIGIKANFFNIQKRVNPYIGFMYGYNTVIQVTVYNYYGISSQGYTDVYDGPSFQGGIEFRTYDRRNYFDISLIYPIRAEETNNYVYTQRPWPVLFSIGMHIGIGRWH